MSHIAVKAAKFIAGTAATAGSGVVINNVIKHCTPEDISTYEKVATYIGGAVLSGMVGKAASTYVEDGIQKMADSFPKRRTQHEDPVTDED